ncbi:hypothetical protein FDH65_gp47 [Arthrobacter phage Circum]|uniref:Helix-turn-helix DNA-binding domain protein n=1 Tax=Arthrobacter phage Circum TaxID=1772295 RepID=A0A0U4JYM8_9CAUD|nr:hypothetical protein FDH65_gp47 [Arthrobacter phage Circum]ALY08732.1 helix-turn-helix DNA-binding domain protein [Arthrobacter phage Circum]
MPTPVNKIQAKYIPTESVLALISHLEYRPALIGVPKSYRNPIELYRIKNVLISDIHKLWNTIPPKVINAKLNRLIRKGLIDGCTCGCRGDFELTDAGREMLETSSDA